MRRYEFLRGGLASWLGLLFGPLKAREAMAASVQVPKPIAAWDAVEFSFEKGGREFPGIAVRLPGVDGKAGEIYTVCKLCTHEACVFGYETNFGAVGRMVDVKLDNPVLFCRCHLSVFDPARGGQVRNGPAKRAPWRFTVEDHGEHLTVTEIEGGAGEIK